MFPPHGLGDEIDIVNRTINFKLLKFKLEKTVIYELLNLYSPENCRDYNMLDYEGQFKTEDFLDWKHNFYKNDLSYNDIKENPYDYNRISKWSNFWKILHTRLNLKKNFNTYFVLINIMHEEKWQAIIIKNGKYQIITKENYLNYENNYILSKEIPYEQIINDIKTIHQITINKLKFIPSNKLIHIFKEKKYLNMIGEYKIILSKEDINLLGDICILDNLYNFKSIPLEIFRKNYKNISEKYITFSELVGSKNVNKFSHDLFFNITNNVYEINKTLSTAQYYYFFVFKQSFNISKELIKNNFLDLNIKFLPAYFTELYDIFKIILNSLFVIGAEGGHMHIALHAGVPYLLVIPDLFFSSIEGSMLKPNFNEYALITVFSYIITRYPICKLFITTEKDIEQDINFVIEEMNYKVALLNTTNLHANPLFYHKYDYIISKNEYHTKFIFEVFLKALELNYNNVYKN